MGPRSCERGKAESASSPGPYCELQWGRVRVNAERVHAPSHPNRDGMASMGPRSCERGKGENDATKPCTEELQWGRVRVNAERMK